MLIAARFGVAGMTAATRRFESAAAEVARSSLPEANADLPGAVVETIQSKHAFAANAAVVRTADEMAKQMLDIIA
jgi:flagellar hook protein FlgE